MYSTATSENCFHNVIFGCRSTFTSNDLNGRNTATAATRCSAGSGQPGLKTSGGCTNTLGQIWKKLPHLRQRLGWIQLLLHHLFISGWAVVLHSPHVQKHNMLHICTSLRGWMSHNTWSWNSQDDMPSLFLWGLRHLGGTQPRRDLFACPLCRGRRGTGTNRGVSRQCSARRLKRGDKICPHRCLANRCTSTSGSNFGFSVLNWWSGRIGSWPSKKFWNLGVSVYPNIACYPTYILIGLSLRIENDQTLDLGSRNSWKHAICCLSFPLLFLLHPPFCAGKMLWFDGSISYSIGSAANIPKSKPAAYALWSGRPSLWLPTRLSSHRLPVVRHCRVCRVEGKGFLLLIPMGSYGTICW